MEIEIVDLPIKHGDFPYVSLPEGNPYEGFQKCIPISWDGCRGVPLGNPKILIHVFVRPNPLAWILDARFVECGPSVGDVKIKDLLWDPTSPGMYWDSLGICFFSGLHLGSFTSFKIMDQWPLILGLNASTMVKPTYPNQVELQVEKNGFEMHQQQWE